MAFLDALKNKPTFLDGFVQNWTGKPPRLPQFANPNLHFKRPADNSQRAQQLARAISKVESGGQQIKGASGEFGAFQFMPETWKQISKEIAGKVIPQNPQNERGVALQKIKQLLDKGHSEEEVALIWNTSLGGAEKPLIKKGVNQKGIKYDSKTYAANVLSAFRTLAGGFETAEAGTETVRSPEPSTATPTPQRLPTATISLPGNVPQPAFSQNKIADNPEAAKKLIQFFTGESPKTVGEARQRGLVPTNPETFKNWKTLPDNTPIDPRERFLDPIGVGGTVNPLRSTVSRLAKNIHPPQSAPSTPGATPPKIPGSATHTPNPPPQPSYIQKVGKTFNTLKTNILEYVQNTEERIRHLQKRPDLSIDDTTDVYQKMTLMPGRIAAKVEKGYDASQEIAEDIVAIAGRSKNAVDATRKEVNQYLQALHAPERNLALGDEAAGITTADAQAVTSAARSEVKAIADKALNLNRHTLDMLKDSGVISDDLFTNLREKYKNHVPLQRVLDEADDIGDILSGRGLDVRASGIKAARGSKREVNDILTNIMTNYEQAVIRSEKNIVDNVTLNFVRKNQQQLSDLFEIKKPRAVGSAFDNNILLEQTNDPSILQLFEHGKRVWIKVKDPHLAIAIRGVGREKLGSFMGAVNAVTRFYSGLNTRFNPEFALPNKIRDLQETMTFLASQRDVGFRGAAKAAFKDPKSIMEVATALKNPKSEWARLYEEMRSLGGTTGGMGLSTRKQVEINVDKIFNIARSRPRQAAQKLVEYVDNFNTVFEDSTRLSVYKSALDRGLSKERAAFLAKEASINFNRMGKGGPVINALYMFSNASVQGSVKMIRAMADPKVAASVVTAIGSSVAAVNEWNDSIDPDWRSKVTKWDRMNSLTVMLPSDQGARYFSIPVGWGLKPILVMANGAHDALSTDDFDIAQLSKDLLNSVLNAYNPVGGTDVSSALVPTVADMPVDIARNQSWSGAKIRPNWNPSAPKDIQYFESLENTVQGRATIATTKAVQENTGIAISPADLNYAIEQLIGGAGRAIKKSFNTITGFWSDEPVPADEYPFVSRFFRQRDDDEIGAGTQEAQEIRLLKSKADREAFFRRKEAEKIHDELKSLSPDEANARYKILKETSPLVAEKLKQIAKAEKKGLTAIEEAIQDLPVADGTRASYIFRELEKLGEKEAKNAKYKEWKNKGLISSEVAKQLQALVKDQMIK